MLSSKVAFLFPVLALASQVLLSWYTLKIINQKISFKYTVIKLFITYFIFYFFYKCIVFNGAFESLAAMYSNKFEAYAVILIIFALFSLYSGILSAMIHTARWIKPRFYQCLLLSLLTLAFDYLNRIYLPHPTYYFLLDIKHVGYLLSVVGHNVFCVLYFLMCFLVAESLINKQYKKILLLSVVIGSIFMAVPEFQPSHNEHSGKSIRLILVQYRKIDESKLHSILLSIKDIINSSSYSTHSNVPILILFPEYVFDKNSIEYQSLLKFIQSERSGSQLFWVLGSSEKIIKFASVKNLVEVYSQAKLLTGHTKTKLFPVGEKEIDLFFLPKKYFVPSTKIITGNEEISSFRIRNQELDLQVINTICYESIFMDIIKSVINPKVKDRLIINLSYDGMLKGTSLSYMHDLATRWNAVSLGSHLARISTQEYTGIWNSTGTNIGKLESNVDSVKQFQIFFPL